MKNTISAFVTNLPKEVATDCAMSAILIVGFTLIGFLSRAMVIDLQANLMMMN